MDPQLKAFLAKPRTLSSDAIIIYRNGEYVAASTQTLNTWKERGQAVDYKIIGGVSKSDPTILQAPQDLQKQLSALDIQKAQLDTLLEPTTGLRLDDQGNFIPRDSTSDNTIYIDGNNLPKNAPATSPSTPSSAGAPITTNTGTIGATSGWVSGNSIDWKTYSPQKQSSSPLANVGTVGSSGVPGAQSAGTGYKETPDGKSPILPHRPEYYTSYTGLDILDNLIDSLNGQKQAYYAGTETTMALDQSNFEGGKLDLTKVFDAAEGTKFKLNDGSEVTKEQILNNKSFLTRVNGIATTTRFNTEPLKNFEVLIRAGVPINEIGVNPLPKQTLISAQTGPDFSSFEKAAQGLTAGQGNMDTAVPNQSITDKTGKSGQ